MTWWDSESLPRPGQTAWDGQHVRQPTANSRPSRSARNAQSIRAGGVNEISAHGDLLVRTSRRRVPPTDNLSGDFGLWMTT